MEKKLLFIKKLEKYLDRKRFYPYVMSLILIAFVLGSCSQQKETQKETNGSSLLFPVMQNGKWGYIDITGKIIISPQFDAANKFFEELGLVNIGGKEGWQIGYTIFSLKGGKWGYVDKNGKYIINPQFDGVGNFEGGLAEAKVGASRDKDGSMMGGKWGYIDKNGKFVWNPTD